MTNAIRIVAGLIVLVAVSIAIVTVIRWVNTPPEFFEVREWVKKGNLAAVDRALTRGFDVDNGAAELLPAAIDAYFSPS